MKARTKLRDSASLQACSHTFFIFIYLHFYKSGGTKQQQQTAIIIIIIGWSDYYCCKTLTLQEIGNQIDLCVEFTGTKNPCKLIHAEEINELESHHDP